VFTCEGIEIVKAGVRVPRMNSITERWVQTRRRELLDRTLIWNHTHLLHALRDFETFYNGHRPHVLCTAPRHCAHGRIRSPTLPGSTTSTSADVTGSAAYCTSMRMPLDLRGWSFRHRGVGIAPFPQHRSASAPHLTRHDPSDDHHAWY